jgi:RNase P subunit RPR2
MMAKKLIYLLQFSEERERMGRNGRRRYLEDMMHHDGKKDDGML